MKEVCPHCLGHKIGLDGRPCRFCDSNGMIEWIDFDDRVDDEVDRELEKRMFEGEE